MASSTEKLASSWPSKPSSPELVDSTEAITAGHETTSGDASTTTPTYRTYKRRWFGLMQLVLMNVAVSWDWLTYAPVATHAATYYSVSISAINWLSTAFFLSFVAVFPLAILTLHRGPKPALITAAILLLLGNWIRYSGSHDPSHGLFPCAMAGEIIIGFAQPFVLAAPSRYSDLWFTDRGRVAATALASLSNPLGAALAQLVNPLWVDDSPRHIPRMLLYVSLLSSACAVPSFFVPSHPPTPVGPSSTTPKLPLAASLRAAARSLELWLVLIPFAVYVGLFNSLSSLLNQVLVPYGFSDDQAGIGGAILIVVGLVCAAAASPLLDRSKKLILATKVLVPLLAIAYLVFLWMPETRSVAGPYVVLALLGASSFILVPVAVELLVELSHPISPEITSAIAWAGGQLLGAVFIILSNALAGGAEAQPPHNLRRALILQAVVALAVAPLILSLGLFGRKDKIALRRLRLDQAGRESQLQTALATV